MSKSEYKINFNSDALNGLRGLMSVHIILLHVFQYCIFEIQLFAQVHMPLFFLLSGFCMTLSYGKTQYDGFNYFCISTQTHENEGSEVKIFETGNFLIGRCIRILPIYWITFILALLLVFVGHSCYPPDADFGYLVGNCIVFLLMIQTWIGQLAGACPNGPAWTISTLFFFYFNYPW